MKKHLFSFFLAVLLILSLTVPAIAASRAVSSYPTLEGLEEPFPPEWCTEVSHGKAPVSKISPRKAEKTGIWGWKALDLLLGDLK